MNRHRQVGGQSIRTRVETSPEGEHLDLYPSLVQLADEAERLLMQPLHRGKRYVGENDGDSHRLLRKAEAKPAAIASAE